MERFDVRVGGEARLWTQSCSEIPTLPEDLFQFLDEGPVDVGSPPRFRSVWGHSPSQPLVSYHHSGTGIPYLTPQEASSIIVDPGCGGFKSPSG